jgi:hypothetical protein
MQEHNLKAARPVPVRVVFHTGVIVRPRAIIVGVTVAGPASPQAALAGLFGPRDVDGRPGV